MPKPFYIIVIILSIITIAEQYNVKVKTDSTGLRTCILQDVNIHSRLGNAYYVEAPGNTMGAFTIPRQHVLSWSPPEVKE